jgi:hypothetical protein
MLWHLWFSEVCKIEFCVEYRVIILYFEETEVETQWWDYYEKLQMYCGVAPRGRSIERPLLINGYAYLAVSLPDNGQVDSNS